MSIIRNTPPERDLVPGTVGVPIGDRHQATIQFIESSELLFQVFPEFRYAVISVVARVPPTTHLIVDLPADNSRMSPVMGSHDGNQLRHVLPVQRVVQAHEPQAPPSGGARRPH